MGAEKVHQLEISSCCGRISVNITLQLAQARIRPFELFFCIFVHHENIFT